MSYSILSSLPNVLIAASAIALTQLTLFTEEAKATHGYDQRIYPLAACGDDISEHDLSRPIQLFPVFVSGSNQTLEKIKTDYCRDAFKTRLESGETVVQVASFTGKSNANAFSNFLESEGFLSKIGKPTIIAQQYSPSNSEDTASNDKYPRAESKPSLLSPTTPLTVDDLRPWVEIEMDFGDGYDRTIKNQWYHPNPIEVEGKIITVVFLAEPNRDRILEGAPDILVKRFGDKIANINPWRFDCQTGALKIMYFDPPVVVHPGGEIRKIVDMPSVFVSAKPETAPLTMRDWESLEVVDSSFSSSWLEDSDLSDRNRELISQMCEAAGL